MSVRVTGPIERERYHGDLAFIGRDLDDLVKAINAALSRLEPTVIEFTPRLVGTTLGGSGTYTAQGGWWIQVGPFVMVNGALAWSNHTGTGNMRIAGLPRRAINQIQHGAGYRATCALSASAMTFANQLVGRITEGSREILIASISSGGAVAETAMDTSGALNFAAVYLTDEV